MTQHIDAAVEDTLALRRIQLVDELCRVVLVGLLIPVETKRLSDCDGNFGYVFFSFRQVLYTIPGMDLPSCYSAGASKM